MVAAVAFLLALILGTFGTIAFTQPGPPPLPQPAAASVIFSAQPINWGFLNSPSPDTYLLPMDPDVNPLPTSLASSRWYWLLPAPGVLYRLHVAGDATLFGSVNSIVDANATALAVSLDLWINGSFVKHLLAIPPATATFDVIATPMFSVGRYDRYQYVFNLTDSDGSGSIGDFLVSASWLPLSR